MREAEQFPLPAERPRWAAGLSAPAGARGTGDELLAYDTRKVEIAVVSWRQTERPCVSG